MPDKKTILNPMRFPGQCDQTSAAKQAMLAPASQPHHLVYHEEFKAIHILIYNSLNKVSLVGVFVGYSDVSD